MDLLIWTLVLLVIIGAVAFLLKVLRPPRPKPAPARPPAPAGYLRRWNADRRWVADQERLAWDRRFAEAQLQNRR